MTRFVCNRLTPGYVGKCFVGCVAMILCLMAFNSSLSRAATEPEVSAAAATMIDVHSGRILYEKNADEHRKIASITKIMTAIIAIEHGDLSSQVTVSSRAAGKEGSSIYLNVGEKITLEHLLYGLMLRSGNDAAVAIAEHIGGSVPGFVWLMNEKAEYLGMTNSHFANPHGLDDEAHYSTAHDMALLTAYALKNDVFQKVVSTVSIKVPAPGETWDRKWYNKNKILKMYSGADGVKTGYTSQAKRTLVTSATRDSQQLATVTLNAPDDWHDATALLNYGFDTFERCRVVKEGDVVDTDLSQDLESAMTVVTGASFHYPLTERERVDLVKKIDIRGELPPGLKPGIEIGRMGFWLQDKEIGSVPLVTKRRQPATSDFSLHGIWADWMSLISPVWSESSR